MKSRLKEIKENHEFRKGEGWELTILTEDIDWLIEQAEKVEQQKNKFDDAIYALEMRKRYWQEKLRVAKFKDEKINIPIFEQKINELDLAIKKLQ